VARQSGQPWHTDRWFTSPRIFDDEITATF
jgi:hypothetical protein